MLGTLLAAGGLGALAGCPLTDAPADDRMSDLEVSVPERSLIDDPSGLVVSGVADGVTVDVTASATDDTGRRWASEASFTASGETLAIDDAEPSAGTWTDADPYGLFWSKRTDGTTDDETTTNETTDGETTDDGTTDGEPFRVAEAYDVEITVAAGSGGGRETATTIRRRRFDPGVTHRTVTDGVVRGEFVRPPDDRTGPGVLLLHGSFGEPLTDHASLLASRGYPTLALRYYGPPDPLPDDLAEVPVENVFEALAWLAGRPAVTGSIAVAGASKGGELALLTGALADDVDAVVSYAGSGVVFQGIETRGSSWTHGGEPVPFVPYARDADFSGPRLRDAYDATLDAASAERIDDATIPVEDVDGPLLLFSPEDDAMWSSERQQRYAAERREANGRSVEHVTYPGAGHWIEGRVSLPSQHADRREGFAQGGTPAGNGRANVDSWERTLEVLGSLREE